MCRKIGVKKERCPNKIKEYIKSGGRKRNNIPIKI